MLAESRGSQPQGPLVMVTDDELSIREALCDLLESVGLRALPFGSASEMLASPQLKAANCLVLDIRLPGMSGLELQHQLARAGVTAPVIFVTGHGDIPMSVKAMKAGAVDFLTKPIDVPVLLAAVGRALTRDDADRATRAQQAEFRQRFERLTPREREVFAHLISGQLNKQVGYDLGITERTVKLHRHQVLEKMEADSIAELVRIAADLEIASIGRVR